MIKVCLEEPSDPAWVAWREDAREATEELKARFAAGERPKPTNLYKKMRSILFDAFSGKCAYCEAHIALDQTGDVEHFRPKAGVLDEHDQKVDHPGYYWLAYEWSNLLPSCILCNRPKRLTDGRLVGKGERFPVAGRRAIAPGEEDSERPLFLHPCVDDPEEHLELDRETGILHALTPRGKTTIELLDLNREGMPEARRKAYLDVEVNLAMAILSTIKHDGDGATQHGNYLSDYHLGKAAFSCAGRKAIRDGEDDIKRFLRMFSR